MKRIFALTLILAMMLSILSGCDASLTDNNSQPDDRSQGGDSQADDYAVSHIQIKSGDNTIFPFGWLIWSEIDNGNGTFTTTEATRRDVVELVNGKTDFPVTDIPRLVLDDNVSYLVQVNGQVAKVYLLAPNGNEYTKTETTFDALSDLAKGTYYVVLEVRLIGNCDTDALQHSYRYEDIFCLVVEKDDESVATDTIIYSSPDILSQITLDDSDKQIILDILGSDGEWISDVPACDWICRFSGYVNIGYCDCGILSDFGKNRSRGLTAEEKERIEDLIARYNRDDSQEDSQEDSDDDSDDDLTHSGYTTSFKIFQYTWDGWGISSKTIDACDVGYRIIDALENMRETGETVPKISDDVLELGGGHYSTERGTMWIECDNKIYRLTPDFSQICLVETHFGKGKTLEITEEFKTDLNNAWNYYPFDYYTGTYHYLGDSTVELKSVFKSDSSVKLSIKDIKVENNYDPENTMSVELISTVDQTVSVSLRCAASADNLAKGDNQTVELAKGEPKTVELTFGGWPHGRYWVYITVDNTKAEIMIEL